MNFVYQTFFGITKQRSVPVETAASIENDQMYNELFEQQQYPVEELDKEDLQQLYDAENERVKQWRDPKFKENVNLYVRENYNRDVNATNKQSLKIYRRMYEKDIRPNDAYSLIDKIQHHPDLTIIDNDYINTLRKRTLRNAGIGQLSVFAMMFLVYKNYPAYRTTKFLGFMVTSPALALLAAFYINNQVSLSRVRRIGLDKKYGLA